MKVIRKIVIILFALSGALMLLLFGTAPRASVAPRPAESVSAAPEAPAPTQSAGLITITPPTPEPTPGPDYSGLLRISELMVKNRASFLLDGEFPDWVEIENISAEPVELSGWSLSDQELGGRRAFSDAALEPGGLLLVPCVGEVDFSLSEGEVLSLYDPDGGVQDQVSCDLDRADLSLVCDGEGGFAVCHWPTPGLPNNTASYDQLCAAREDTSPLLIDEVMVSDKDLAVSNGKSFDWVTVRNVSGETLSLEGYTLSDDWKEPGKWAFSSGNLKAGEQKLLLCDKESDPSAGNTGFSLNGLSEQLYLFDAEGQLVDYVALHDIPVEGSMGRLPGEKGFFYFPTPTPFENNREGFRRVSDRPVSLTADGVFDDCESVSVQLSGPGPIRYTTDGSLPTASSALYEGPIELTQTTVLRAVAFEEGSAPSRPASFSFIINEGHTLPVLSLVTDDPGRFNTIYSNGNKVRELAANLSLYENGERVFCQDCDVSMKGWTSLDLPKKSMGVEFKGRYDGMLECDVFGNGISEYASLNIRSGQDYTFSVFRNEMFQNLCKEASDALYTQESKYCILYLNGRYWGVYCLKEDISRQYYASNAGVSVDSVDYMKAPFALGTDIMDLVQMTWHVNMTEEQNYSKVGELFNMDSLVDWLLFESYTANTDTQGNLKVFRSPENGNRWDLVFYDLDWGFYYPNCAFIVLIYGHANSGNQMPALYEHLVPVKDFRERVFTRYAELVGGVLSNEHVLEKIDEYQAYLEPEMPRDRERWHLTMDGWYSEVDKLRNYINENNWADYTVSRLRTTFNMTSAEMQEYFGK